MRIKERIRRSVSGNKKEIVFLTRDFAGFGSRRAVAQALKELVSEEFLYRISIGIYAKTRYNSFGKMRVAVEPLGELASQAMKRLGISFSLGKMAKLYAAGKINQIPQKDIFEIGKQNISRRFELYGKKVYYEKDGVIQNREK